MKRLNKFEKAKVFRALYLQVMNSKEEYLIKSYQHLMEPHEKILTRWLTENWDQITPKLPSWLHTKIWQHYAMKTINSPDALARNILFCVSMADEY